MPKKLDTSISDLEEPIIIKKEEKSDFLFNLSKRAGITVVPYSERQVTNKTIYYDTGSYTLNALISGSCFGGIPSDSIIGIAGEHATGKTFIALSICEHFLENYPTGVVVYFDTEHAVKEHHVEGRYLPKNRFAHTEVNTLEEFRFTVTKILGDYMTREENNRPPLLLVLDSLGNISTLKEMAEAEKPLDKLAKDMTKAQLVRSVFRVLSIKLGQANVPLIVTNHVGVKIGGFTRPGAPPAKEMCLVEGSKIRTMQGSIEIENVKVGDVLPTTAGTDCVDKIYTFESSDVYEIEFEDGSFVKCTGAHKFLLPELEWICADWIDWVSGHCFVLSIGNSGIKELKIKSIEKLEGSFTVKDIRLYKTHHYILENGVISHNSGGEGLKYAADTILFLSKKKVYDKALKVYTGSELNARLYKSRHTIENLTAPTLLDYQTGMDRYYGLFEIAKKLGVAEKCGNGFKFADSKQFHMKDIQENPEQFYTDAVLAAIEEKVATAFRYGQGVPMSLSADDEDEEELNQQQE